MPPTGRTQRALIAALLSYGQFAVAIAAAFFVTPLILRTLGARQYGIWLSSGEVVGYFLLLDFGVFAILPWLIARADGQKQPGELKRYLSQALAVAISLSALLFVAALSFWGKLPQALHLTAEEWRVLAGPLGILVLLLAFNLPLNLFTSLLGGLQDVRFCGLLGLARVVAGPAITVGLLLGGHRLYALAFGAALFSPLGGVGSYLRARKLAPDLLRDWPRPTLAGTAQLFRESIGAWLAGVGVQLTERSSALVLTLMGNPTIVPTLICTSRVSQILTQMAWVVPDSALVGFAQLGGENNPARVRAVALSIIRLHLVLAAGAACMVLALNPAFVRIWVGENYFGGPLLNLLLASKVISGSLVHSLATIIAVQGNRLNIGLATLLQGGIYLALALLLSSRFSLSGLLAADLIAPLFSILPISLWILRTSMRLSLREVGSDVVSILFLRAGPCLLAAWAYSEWRGSKASLVELMVVGIMVAYVYLRFMASRVATFPLPGSVKVWLRRLRLV